MVFCPVSVKLVMQSQNCVTFACRSLVNQVVRVLRQVSSIIFTVREALSLVSLPLTFDHDALPAIGRSVVSANVNFIKLLAKIGEVHPKNAVFNQLFDSAHVLDPCSPELRFVRPITVPLSASPWISEANKLVLVNLHKLENTVSMTLYDSSV